MSAAHASVKRYLIIWAWLAGLMLLGVILSELSILPLPHTGVMAVVAGLSTVKAGLVALYYMHLKTDQRLLALVLLAPFLLVALALGVVFSSVFIKL
jgi:caa(3)-type oxidase subunit IV